MGTCGVAYTAGSREVAGLGVTGGRQVLVACPAARVSSRSQLRSGNLVSGVLVCISSIHRTTRSCHLEMYAETATGRSLRITRVSAHTAYWLAGSQPTVLYGTASTLATVAPRHTRAEAQAAYAAMHALEDEASALAARVGCVACVLGDAPSQVRRA